MHLPVGGDNAFFLDLYSRYRRDRSSVPADWAFYFETTFEDASAPSPQRSTAHYLAPLLCDAYRQYGHLEAALDPLGLAPRETVPLLNRLRADADEAGEEVVDIKLAGRAQRYSLSALNDDLSRIYAGHVGIEAAHLTDEGEREWFYAAMEAAFGAPPDGGVLGRALTSIALADEFEGFCRLKFPTKKRFGVEGGEAAIAFLRELLLSASPDVDDVVMGGMHRGRLSLLATVLGKPLAALFGELKGHDFTDGSVTFTGDVPYHLGYAGELNHDGRTMRVRLLPHPSHLAVVAPVTLGQARATQAGRDVDPTRTFCVLLHTDAAFSGQGLISEIMQLGGLAGYSVRGSVHLVVNNQIGFTTLPSEGRSSRYCTDIGKSVGAPILHVNADDPLAVARVAQIAYGWRRRFGKDVLIDLVCYRRYGHNELDEPRFTQPATWAAIDTHAPVRTSFAAQVKALFPEAEARAGAAVETFREELRASYDASASFRDNSRIDQGRAWETVAAADEEALMRDDVATGLDLDELRRLGGSTGLVPEGLEPHWKVRKFYEARNATITEGDGLNFATAEALAFASLLAEGIPVRLSGQDAVRGTFTQRHLALHAEDGAGSFFPLSALAQEGARLEAVNSPLTEYAVLGFEYGYSLADPRQLVMWEAQFGDFLNGAQVMVDQYVASAEAKWGLQSGLVVLLPHGLEGQGPDHSSARIERLLQLCAAGNMLVVNPSTPANLFHLLRRQMLAPWRKPLFVIAPKSLLRAKAAVSPLADMGPGTRFRPLLPDMGVDPGKVRRVVLSSGKIHYELAEARAAAGLSGEIALVRVEQLYPFPHHALAKLRETYSGAEWVWCQEEPRNQGPWHHVLRELSGKVPLGYAGRPAMPVSAAGSVERHEAEQRDLLARALDLSSVSDS
ncbi:2-oxoglutarate dehydrogenase E1 component [Aquabacter sp. CN5-332]|uniref:2-oxoglutarate dehydrogenase E1 component n=1 Tax=Aquabacter sp. CN5-332 TaxID=3156608 RepID=UPI0032B44746